MDNEENFFSAQSRASAVKATIITKFFDTWSNILLPSAKRNGGKLVYMDLYCGPGTYGDGTKSTPLLVLEKAIAKPELARILVTIFNDQNQEAIEKLRSAVKQLPGIDTLKNPPVLLNEKVDQETAVYFKNTSIAPSFTFIDPFGYVGLTRDLIEGVTKNFGCDCIFFFNYSRINAALSTSIFRERMTAIFGAKRALALETKMKGVKGKPHEREEAIIETLTDALEELNNGDNFVRSFRFRKNNRTSHMLVFVTKSEKGYRVMNEIMAKAGFCDAKGIPFYTHYENYEPSRVKLFYDEFDELKEMLCADFSGRSLSMSDIFKEHGLRKNYIESNYKDALKELEAENRIVASPPASKRPKRGGKPTFSGSTIVTFPAGVD